MDKGMRRLLIISCVVITLSVVVICIVVVRSSIVRSRAEAAASQFAEQRRAELEANAKAVEAENSRRAAVAAAESRQASGRGDDRRAAIDSFVTRGSTQKGTLDSLVVISVVPSGALATYGLQNGDEIVSVNGMKIGDLAVNDPDTAKAMVVQNGFQAGAPIVVRRQGGLVTLSKSP